MKWKTGWVNIYRNGDGEWISTVIHDSPEEARNGRANASAYACIKIRYKRGQGLSEPSRGHQKKKKAERTKRPKTDREADGEKNRKEKNRKEKTEKIRIMPP